MRMSNQQKRELCFIQTPYPLQYSEKMINDGGEMTDSVSPLLDRPVAGREKGDLSKVTWKDDTLQNLGLTAFDLYYTELFQSYIERDHLCGFLL